MSFRFPRFRRARRASPVLACALGIVFFTGCTSSQRNRWHFAVAEVPADVTQEVRLKFYRVNIKGYSVNGKAELLSGMYDAAALHELFGEVKRDESPANKATAAHDHSEGAKSESESLATSNLVCSRELKELEIVPPEARLTIFYGVDASAMANSLEQFGKSTENGEQLAGLLLAASGAGEAKLKADNAEGVATTLSKSVTDASKATRDVKIDATNAGDIDKSFAKLTATILNSLGSKTTVSETDSNWSTTAAAALTLQREKENNQ